MRDPQDVDFDPLSPFRSVRRFPVLRPPVCDKRAERPLLAVGPAFDSSSFRARDTACCYFCSLLTNSSEISGKGRGKRGFMGPRESLWRSEGGRLSKCVVDEKGTLWVLAECHWALLPSAEQRSVARVAEESSRRDGIEQDPAGSTNRNCRDRRESKLKSKAKTTASAKEDSTNAARRPRPTREEEAHIPCPERAHTPQWSASHARPMCKAARAAPRRRRLFRRLISRLKLHD